MPSKAMPKNMTKKGMVITVGVGSGIESVIVLSIKNANPDFVVFLVTEEAKKTTLNRIQQFANENKIKLPPITKQLVSNENDVQVAYKAAVEAIKKLQKKGVKPRDITVDYTTGSKPMSAGALYAAIMEGCNNVVYVTGKRDKNGRVISGTEQSLTAAPNELIAHWVRKEAVRLFNAWQFSAAEKVIDEFLSVFPPDKVGELFPDLDGLRRLCRAYAAWDAFDHIAAKKAFDDVDKSVINLWSPQIAQNKGWVNMIASTLQSNDPSRQLCPKLLVDLWANALRRLEENRFVDAVARLYRLAELLAQFRLWRKYQIDTGDVDMSKVPDNLRTEFERYRDKKGKVKISLQADYELLCALGDELGKEWQQGELKEVMRARNNSIAAHGLEPVNEELALKLMGAIEPILKRLVPNLHELLKKAEFPSLEP